MSGGGFWLGLALAAGTLASPAYAAQDPVGDSVTREARGPQSPSRPDFSGRWGRGGAGGASAGGGLSPGEVSALLTPAQVLQLTHEDPMLLVVDERGQRQRLFTDFRGASVSASGGLQQRVAVAGWEGAALVVETTMLGKKLVQEYRIDPGTGQLVISSAVQASAAPPVSYRLVYDRL